jgi:hypothetical protein
MRITRLSLRVAAFSITLAIAGSALADDPCNDVPNAPQQTVSVERSGGRVVHVLPPQRVCGERQTPQAFALSGRSPLNYTQVEAGEHFVQPIVAAVRRAPF